MVPKKVRCEVIDQLSDSSLEVIHATACLAWRQLLTPVFARPADAGKVAGDKCEAYGGFSLRSFQ